MSEIATHGGVTRLPDQRCPICTEILSAAGTPDGRDHAPSPGDLTLCVYCLRWLVYTRLDDAAPLRLRAFSAAEWDRLSEQDRTDLDQVFTRAERAWRTSDGRRRATQKTRPQ